MERESIALLGLLYYPGTCEMFSLSPVQPFIFHIYITRSHVIIINKGYNDPFEAEGGGLNTKASQSLHIYLHYIYTHAYVYMIHTFIFGIRLFSVEKYFDNVNVLYDRF